MFSATPVKDSLVVFTEGARVNFKMWGHVAPVFGVNIDGTPQLIPIIFEKPADKDAFRRNILNLIAQNKLKEFVFVVECWIAALDDNSSKHLSEHGTLEEFPGRQEAVQVFYCSPSEEISYTAIINRDTIATLGEWTVTRRNANYGFDDFTSRFQGLFALGKAGTN